MKNQPKIKTDPSSEGSCQGRLFIISAPSGTGKTTLCRAIRSRFPDLRYSVSYTTRAPRTGEQDGQDYFFISAEEFKNNIQRNTWAEWAEVHDHFYGTSAEYIDRHLAQNHDILLDIDVNGARQILARYPGSISIFIMPPTFETLEQRLIKRGTDSAQTIARRLKNAETEIAQKGLYKHIIINDRLSDAVEALARIIRSDP
ncbi:MAG: guanylate kinase [Desulfobacteraceae bacterium]|nr:MAG: guanylate kinase [Desulfobacteraceae bacterium]